MARVTMKAFSLRPTTMKPLRKPAMAPTRSTAISPTAVGTSTPKPKLAAGRTSMAPIAGAKPAVDSSDRSNLPVMTISDSASTTSASAADEVRMVMMLAALRKTGLTRAPTTMSMISAGKRARSRRRNALRPRARAGVAGAR